MRFGAGASRSEPTESSTSRLRSTTSTFPWSVRVSLRVTESVGSPSREIGVHLADRWQRVAGLPRQRPHAGGNAIQVCFDSGERCSQVVAE